MGSGGMTGTGARLMSVLLVPAVLAGCGAADPEEGPTARFASPGFGITFEYPVTLTEQVPRGADESPDNVVRELTLTDDDFIAVRRDPVGPEVLTAGATGLRPTVDQLAAVLDPRVGPGRAITAGGMLGFEYLSADGGVENLYAFYLGADALYLVHCRSTAEHRTQLAHACATVERTVHPT